MADEFLATDWIDPTSPTPVQAEFLGSLAVASLPYRNFRAFYLALADRAIALDCATRTGSFLLETGADRLEKQRQVLAACRNLELRIAEERASLKKETQFNRQVERNVRIKQMEKELDLKVAAL